MEESNKDGKYKFNRREILKSLATIPVLGGLAYGWYRKLQYDRLRNSKLLSQLNLTASPPPLKKSSGEKIRLGLIGYGGRGNHLARAAGFAHPELISSWKEEARENPTDHRYRDYMEQEDLKLEVTAICDIYDIRANNAIQAGANIHRNPSGGEMGKAPIRYKTYQELLKDKNVDAVIIGTPDHWHAPITIAAAKAGKHVYCEKPMTWTVPETYDVVNAVKESGIVFQLGHQGRQNESYFKAREAIEKDVLGKITLIEVTTNRNSPNGAWVYPIDEEANRSNIDWDQFIGPAPWHDFSLKRFFRWRCWWDYSTGLSGDLLTHEFDAMNQIMDLGIPASAMSSGGIYYYKDGRTVPDVLQTAFEYPERDLTMLYSATLASTRKRGRVIMGHDASMDLSSNMIINVDRDSDRYKEQIKEGLINPDVPLYTYTPGQKQVDAITSPTEQYFAGRGLLYSYRDGKRVDTTFLHIKEWVDCIREGRQPSCNVDQGFHEAMAAHMGTISYHEKRKVYWDEGKQKIV
ncbi:MAG: Gfo/Idh/MocA family oxidoreductase [Bacteroidales bacterium]|nr:Gfo/Idh/MocA family oxidoreductase [Bacteroidales bacterium]MCF8397715.1 Gfo/Idh/MocA family oxidoreductase [Bacteroidales bacterium]